MKTLTGRVNLDRKRGGILWWGLVSIFTFNQLKKKKEKKKVKEKEKERKRERERKKRDTKFEI